MNQFGNDKFRMYCCKYCVHIALLLCNGESIQEKHITTYLYKDTRFFLPVCWYISKRDIVVPDAA